MVFFTCNACGESVKKVQVEKHVAVCRNCECLSCIDCGKDFWGDDYKNHVKCISEDEKYGGRGYEGKAHKGDLKQQAWIQKINELVKKPNVSPKVRDLLEQISTFDNIPRKRAKFQNWMKNSLKIDNEAILEQVWSIFSEASRNEPVGKGQEKKPAHPVAHPGAETFAKVLSPGAHGGAPEQLTEVKKNKRERKEERQKNRKKEKKELKLENRRENTTSQKAKKCKKGQEKETGSMETPEANGTARRKGKKQRGPEQGPAGGDADGDRGGEPQATGRAGKRKRKHSEGEASSKKKMMKLPEHSEAGETEDHDPPVKGKFSWKGTIKAVLKQAPDKEIAVKKLRKKVLAQYHAVAGEQHRSEEELLVIFHKKISKNPTFKLLKDKVKLVK